MMLLAKISKLAISVLCVPRKSVKAWVYDTTEYIALQNTFPYRIHYLKVCCKESHFSESAFDAGLECEVDLLEGCRIEKHDLSMHFHSDFGNSKDPWNPTYKFTHWESLDQEKVKRDGIAGSFAWLGPRSCNCVQVSLWNGIIVICDKYMYLSAANSTSNKPKSGGLKRNCRKWGKH